MRKLSLIVLKNSTFGLAAQFSIKLLSFLFSVLIIRKLGADTFGQYSTIIAFGIAFSFFTDLGLSTFSVREIARKRETEDQETISNIYSNVIVIRIILSFITIVLLILAAHLTGRPDIMVGAIALNSLGLLLYSIQGANDSVLMGYERLDISSSAKVINQFTFVVLGAVVLASGWGYYGLIISNLLGLVLMTLVCWNSVQALGIKLIKPTPKVWLHMLRVSFPFGLITLALGLSYKFDTLLLNIYRGDTETGYYSAVYNLVFSAVVLSNVINTSLYPSLSIHSVKSPESLPKIYSIVFRFMMVISLPIAVGGCMAASQLVPFLYTDSYLPAVPALQIIIWVVPFMDVSEFFGYIVVIANQEKVAARSVILSTLVNLVAYFFLVPKFGFIAASIMTVFTEAILVGQYLWTMREITKQIDLISGFIKPLLASLFMGLVIYIFRNNLNIFGMLSLGILTYISALVLIRGLGKDDFSLILRLRNPG